ncbi:hypothetical protein BT96DRAFT_918580 [Gymnopus androsaceus JB14]|uniref:Uncharacterized protein n=1 Tax=Gymnopus androsaceus JB14 TaxID=1447944 RepID=A0A6A4HXZ7_9AGAR|nr:hypothetical protein BT96DRAFT_918580 [Gymnopus androsaceus JB14]
MDFEIQGLCGTKPTLKFSSESLDRRRTWKGFLLFLLYLLAGEDLRGVREPLFGIATTYDAVGNVLYSRPNGSAYFHSTAYAVLFLGYVGIQL